MIYEIFLVSSLVLFALLARANYAAAVVLLAGLLPAYLVRFSVAGVPANMWEAATVVVFLVGLTQPAVRQAGRQAVRQLPLSVLIWLVLWLAAGVVSMIVSAEPRVSAGILKGWIIIPLLFGAQVYIAGVHAPRSVGRMLRAVVVSGVVVAALGAPALLSGERARSIYDVPNSLALYLVPLLVVTAWLGVTTIAVSRLGWQLASLILIVGVLATQSLAAVAAIILTLLVGIGWQYRRASSTPHSAKAPRGRPGLLKRATSGLPAEALAKAGVFPARRGTWLLLLVLIAAPYLLAGRLDYFLATQRSSAPNSFTVRQQLWSVGAELVGDHPLLGVGLGQFEPAYQEKLHERFREIEAARQHGGRVMAEPLREFVFRDPHNWVLSFWLNTGLLGLVSFVAVHVVVIRQAVKGARYPAKKVPDPLVQALLLALFAIALHGLVDTVYWKNDLAALQWLLLVLLLANRQNTHDNDNGDNEG